MSAATNPAAARPSLRRSPAVRVIASIPLFATLYRVAGIVLAKAGRWKVQCPVCNGRFRAFQPAGVVARANARCPQCGALERHRLQWLFLRDRTDLFTRVGRVLHVAPEPALARRLADLPAIDYVTADLVGPGVDACIDITRMAFADDSFDVILCSHVLEHISDDAAAMRDLLRVLKPGGWAMLQVPIEIDRELTLEDPLVTDPRERELLFGQADHVRIYGRDYPRRLRQAGFHVGVDNFAFGLDARTASWYGLWPESIYISRRPAVGR